MKLINKKVKKGFTLFETVLYLAIAGMVIYFISGFAFNSIFGKSRIEIIQGTNNVGQNILDDISNTISDSVEVNNITQ